MSEYDYLNFDKDDYIKTNITKEEEIQFSDKITKINKNGWKQGRYLLMTDKAIYNLKSKTLKRRIEYKTIMGLTIAKQSEEFVIHCEDMDYDYHYIYSNRPLIIGIISKNYQLEKNEELKLFEMNLKNLYDFVTTKKEKEKKQNYSRMPKTCKISLKDYLAKNKVNINININQPEEQSIKSDKLNIQKSSNVSNIPKSSNVSNIPKSSNVSNIPKSTNASNIPNSTNAPNIPKSTNAPNIPKSTNAPNISTNAPNIPNSTNAPNIPKSSNIKKPSNTTYVKKPSNTTYIKNLLNKSNEQKSSTITNTPQLSNITNEPSTNTKKTMTYDDFEIISVIGRGSVGKILLVKYKKDGKYYAMKSMRKDQIASEGIINNIIIEKKILKKNNCEFIMNLNYSFQTSERIYYVCPFIKGGDLYHKLKQDIFLKEDLVRFYTAQVVIALQHIHDLGFAYRDLKPENILINEDGYIKLCDFGSCASIEGKRKEASFAGSPEYAAPEMISFEGHTQMCDWWSLGILIYELLYGNTPFFNLDRNRMYDLIITGSISYPKFIEIEGEETPRNYKVSEDAKNIISKLLDKDPNNRLGNKGIKEIQKHPFFSSINFEDLKKKKAKCPFKPEIITEDSEQTKNFDEEYLNLDIEESPVEEWVQDNKYQSLFDDLSDDNDKNDDFEVITNENLKDIKAQKEDGD